MFCQDHMGPHEPTKYGYCPECNMHWWNQKLLGRTDTVEALDYRHQYRLDMRAATVEELGLARELLALGRVAGMPPVTLEAREVAVGDCEHYLALTDDEIAAERWVRHELAGAQR